MVEEQEVPRKELENHAFQLAKRRVEKSKSIGNDLQGKNSEAEKKQREQEIRQIEGQSKQGEEAKRTGYEEVVIDAKGYSPVRHLVTYQLEGADETVEEVLVSFQKLGEDGEPEWLIVDKGLVCINADLYDGKLTSRLHDQGLEYNSYTIPRVDGHGALRGVVTLFESKQE